MAETVFANLQVQTQNPHPLQQKKIKSHSQY